MLSWEYPPLIEGGLARVVRKQSEGLVELGVEVHVLTRGGEEEPEADVNGVIVHRVREPTRPAELNEFVAWVERMNSDMLAAGVELGDRYDFDIVHGHDWLVANACDHLANRFETPLVMTIHATEHGRHQGWVDKHPQSYIHGVERWITNRSDLVLVCSTFMREQVVDIFGVDHEKVEVLANGIDPEDLQPHDEEGLAKLRAEFATPDQKLVLLVGRLVYEKGFQVALEALPQIIERQPNTRFVVAGSGTHEEELKKQAAELGLMEHGNFRRLDRRRRAALALPDRRRLRGALDLRAVRPRRARGDGLELPLHRRRHRRPARGRSPRRGRAAVPRPRPRVAGRDDASRARGRRALPPAHRRGLQPSAPLRLGRCRRADG